MRLGPLWFVVLAAALVLGGTAHAQTDDGDESAEQALQALKDKQAEFRKLKRDLRKTDVNKDDDRIKLLIRLKDTSTQIAALNMHYQALRRANQVRSRLETYLDDDPKTHWDNLVKRRLQDGADDAPQWVEEHWDLFYDKSERVGGEGAWEWLKRTQPGLAETWTDKQKQKVRKKFRAGDPTALRDGLDLWAFLFGNGYRDVIGAKNPVVVIQEWAGPENFANWRKRQTVDPTTIDFPLSTDVTFQVFLHVDHIADWLRKGGYLTPQNINELRDGINRDPNLSPGDKKVLGGLIDDVVNDNRQQIVELGPLPDRDHDGIPDTLDRNPDAPGGFFDVILSSGSREEEIGGDDIFSGDPAHDAIDDALLGEPGDDVFGGGAGSDTLLVEEEVDALLKRATAATPSQDGIMVIVDRSGRILGVRVEDGVLTSVNNLPAGNQPGQRDFFRVFAIDGAVAKARSAAFLGNNQAPLTSRTFQTISETTLTQRELESIPSISDPNSTVRGPGFVAPLGLNDHVPPGVAFAPQVDQFAIEHTNRDSLFAVGPDNIRGANNGAEQGDDVKLLQRFNVDPQFIPDYIKTPGKTRDPFGRAITLSPPISYGEASGVLPHATPRGLATLPGGIPIYKKDSATGELAQVGGIGVFFPGTTGFATEENSALGSNFDPTQPDRSLEAEFIAFAALGGCKADGAAVGPLGGVNPLPNFELPSGRIDLVGLTLDVFGPNGKDGPKILTELGQKLGAGAVNGQNQPLINPGPDNLVGTPDDGGSVTLLNGTTVPAGFLVAPHASANGLLSKDDVQQMIFQGVQEALVTRAAIRLPNDAFATMISTVTSNTGEILGQFRMPDATIFSIDSSVAKSRNAAYYADPTALQQQDQLPGVPTGTAFTARTFRYLALPRYPDGIDGAPPGPFSQLNDDPGIDRNNVVNPNDGKGSSLGPSLPASQFQSVVGFNAFNPGTNFHDNRTNGVTDPTNPLFFQNQLLNRGGVVFAPGSSPLFKDGKLVGGFGISGDGVDQDDIVTGAGTRGFEVPINLRSDQFFFQNVRLPFQKFNRQPNINPIGNRFGTAVSLGTYQIYVIPTEAPPGADATPPSAGDQDGDGIPDEDDPDRDGDGIRNELDSFPDDPFNGKGNVFLPPVPGTPPGTPRIVPRGPRFGIGAMLGTNQIYVIPTETPPGADPVPPAAGDQDGDGIPDKDDPDRDGDGIRNELDLFPDDPLDGKGNIGLPTTPPGRDPGKIPGTVVPHNFLGGMTLNEAIASLNRRGDEELYRAAIDQAMEAIYTSNLVVLPMFHEKDPDADAHRKMAEELFADLRRHCAVDPPKENYSEDKSFQVGEATTDGKFPVEVVPQGNANAPTYDVSASPNDRFRTSEGTWGQQGGDQWALAKIGLTQELHETAIAENAASARPLVVAIIDSGVDMSHPELWGQIWRNRGEIPFNRFDDDGNGYVDDVYGYNTQANNSDVWDDNGHGTAVAGIIAARWDDRGMAGVAPNCRLMIVKAFNAAGKSDAVRVALAIRYAVLNGARIIHISAESDKPIELDQAMIDWARKQGVLVVAAAGSRGRDTAKIAPAGLRGVLTVGAVDQDDKRAKFSGWGREVDLVAPGLDVLSLRAHGTDFMFTMAGEALGVKAGERIVDERWYRADGTSFAAPLVTGVATALWAKNPELTAEQITNKLIMSCDDVDQPGWDMLTGAGRLNAAKALDADPDDFLATKVFLAEITRRDGRAKIDVTGQAVGKDFQRRWLQVAYGKNPARDEWQTISTSDQPVDDGLLGSIPGNRLARRGAWSIRSLVQDKHGNVRQAIGAVNVD